MDELLFGISGLPINNEAKKNNYASAVDYQQSLGRIESAAEGPLLEMDALLLKHTYYNL